MNKAELKKLFIHTTIDKDSNLFEAWEKAIKELGLTWQILGANKAVCCDEYGSITGSFEEFNVRYIKANFQNLEQFLKEGNKLRVGDWVFSSCGVNCLIEFECIVWNSPDEYDCKRYVIFAQCWFDKPQSTSRHPHADMACCYLRNMDLIIFGKLAEDNAAAWIEVSFSDLFQRNYFDYFLCLPKHKEACLWRLNGGLVQINLGIGGPWQSVDTKSSPVWYRGYWYMDEATESRIKPRKVKRWIAILDDGREVYFNEKPHKVDIIKKICEVEIELCTD